MKRFKYYLLKIKEGYYYLFYKLYVFYENSILVWWSDWKAAVSVDILVFMIFFTVHGLLFSLFRIELLPNNKTIIILIGLTIITFNQFIFFHNNKWKYYVDKFEKLPKRTNRIGGIIVWMIIGIIFAGLVFMYYMLSITSEYK